MNGESLAFIVGHYKSGSTWLANLLSLHPAICGLRETHIFRYSQESEDLAVCSDQLFSSVAWAGGGRKNLLRHRLSNWSRPFRRDGQATLYWRERPTTLLDLSLGDQRRLKRTLAQSSDPDDYCRRFYEFLSKALAPERFLVDKTSTNIAYVPSIRRIFPESKLVVIHRDGRDVVVSDKFHLKNQYQKEQDFRKSVLEWRQCMEMEIQFGSKHDVLRISFEEMKENALSVSKTVLAHLGIPVPDDVVEDMVHRSSFKFVTGRKAGQENKSGFYRKGVRGDWLNHFSDDEKREFSELAGEILVDLGYEESPDWRQWKS